MTTATWRFVAVLFSFMGGAAAECARGDTQLRLHAVASRNASGRWKVTTSASSNVASRQGLRLDLEARLGADEGCDNGWAELNLEADISVAPKGYEPMPFGPQVTSLYRMYAQARTWVEAAALCRSDGAYLIVVNSDAEALVVNEFFARKPEFVDAINPYWFAVGLRRHFGRNETVLGESLEDSGYNKWAPDQWKLKPTTDCGLMDNRLLFALDLCTYKRPFICEWEN